MRSCALRILLAATICIALVIFCVFLMLPICFLSSFAPAMVRQFLSVLERFSCYEALERRPHGVDDLISVFALAIDLIHEISVRSLHVA